MSLPPMHPAIVHLPIALVILAFAADVLARWTRRESLRFVGFWSIIFAFLSGAITIAAEYWDLNRAALNAETRRLVDLHLRVGWTIFAGLFVLTIWRWRIRQQARRVVTKPYVLGSGLVVALTLFQGWYGGELVYSQGAGVAAAGQGTEKAEQAQDRLARVHDALTPGETAVGGPGQQGSREENRGKSRPSE